MIAGSWNADTSQLVADADEYRDELTIQVHTIGKDGAWLSFGTSVPFSLGPLKFPRVGATFHIRGWLARKSVWVYGSGCTGSYQEGFTDVSSEPGL